MREAVVSPAIPVAMSQTVLTTHSGKIFPHSWMSNEAALGYSLFVFLICAASQLIVSTSLSLKKPPQFSTVETVYIV
jgi:hypothetical protein